MPKDLESSVIEEYKKLGKGKFPLVAVRSSATAEDLPTASFAGQQDTYLNVSGPESLLKSVKKCWASLFTPRALAYRVSKNFEHDKVKLAVVVQRMVNSDISGIMFTIDPNSELPHIIIEAGYGLGEALVGGKVTPDTYVVDKFHRKILNRRVSNQTWKLVRGESGECMKEDIPRDLASKQKMTDEQILDLAEVGNQIEMHYDRPMDIEWAMEGGTVYIVQARPVTTLSKDKNNQADKADDKVESSRTILVRGLGASPGKASGPVRIYQEDMSLDVVKQGDIMVTQMTTPDMVPAMTRTAAIITDEGGMTCHAAIVARELGIPCIVGANNATEVLKNGMEVTVHGQTGVVYEGLDKEDKPASTPVAAMAPTAPVTGTKIMVNVGVPQKAEEYAQLPVQGVGLMRIEFLFTSYIQEHPCALIEQGREKELVEKLSQGIATVAKAFYPRPVILRTSDFKTNEYRDMKGGARYEPKEQNPMIGWRGCSRYVSESYRDAFLAELKAIKRARDEMGLTNVWMMLPFVRTVEEVVKIERMMNEVGLYRGNDFKLYLMAEVPVIVFMAEEFAEHCDGFSIGSNDLTQLTMGADRDSDMLGRMGYFDERNTAIKRAIAHLIKHAHNKGVPVGICGQAPSVYPEFCEFLVRAGIDSISLNADTVLKTISYVAAAEQRMVLESIRKQK
ncbi:MAG: putative phosphoenolpyruvate synthase [Methanomassiliicoccales archaeon PtaB.Bin134]|nr:MAG: putative phosphoenolpyruvate synthase [Methanomassiliicoccales archaeon PtaB.Bin134]